MQPKAVELPRELAVLALQARAKKLEAELNFNLAEVPNAADLRERLVTTRKILAQLESSSGTDMQPDCPVITEELSAGIINRALHRLNRAAEDTMVFDPDWPVWAGILRKVLGDGTGEPLEMLVSRLAQKAAASQYDAVVLLQEAVYRASDSRVHPSVHGQLARARTYHELVCAAIAAAWMSDLA